MVAGLLLIAATVPLASAAMHAAALYGVPISRWVVGALNLTHLASAVVLFFWLGWRVFARTTLDRVSWWQRQVWRSAAVTAGGLSMAAAAPGRGVIPDRQLAGLLFECVAGWLAVEVCRVRGLWLDDGPRLRADPRGRAGMWEITDRAFTACVAGGASTWVLWQVFRHIPTPGVPVMQHDQLTTLGDTGLPEFLMGVLLSSALEDVVVVAAVTALLTAARRPAWQVYAVVVTVEVLLHAYFGIPAVGMALYAAGRVWLYRRHGRLWPLVVSHIAFDTIGGTIMWLHLPLAHRLVVAAVLTVVVLAAQTRTHLRHKRTRPRPDAASQSRVRATGSTGT